MRSMLSIGEFSRVTRLTLKTIRLYDEKGLLPPAETNPDTGYRYYDAASVERARVITELKALDFSLADIAQILAAGEDEADMVSFLDRHKDEIARKLDRYQQIHRALDELLTKEREAAKMATESKRTVEEKTVAAMLIAGIRAKGAYDDSKRRFSLLARAVGRQIAGKAMGLHYDGEYKEQDADFESCFPIRRAVQKEGLDVRTLPGGRCLSLVHVGPYEELGRSYRRLFDVAKEKNLKPRLPSREVYLKGPGLIFKGSPRKYLTEIQLFVED